MIAILPNKKNERQKNLSDSIVIEVPFYDVDLMGVVWHGSYVKYMEIARCKLLDQIDYNYLQMSESGFAWPIIDIRIRYSRPLCLQQKVKVNVELVEWENRLKMQYLFLDLASGEKLAKAYTTQVAVDLETKEMLFESPKIVFEKLQLAL